MSQVIQEDEIDLRELFLTLKKNIIFIIFFTLITIFISIIFIVVKKPIYSGNFSLEMGKIINLKSITPLDNIHTIKNILQIKYKVSVSIPKHSYFFTVSYQDNDKESIKNNLLLSLELIKNRYKKLSNIYRESGYKVINTQMIEDIKIDTSPIKPKKKLIVIVAFITGLMFSIFLVFFLSFVRGMSKEEDEKTLAVPTTIKPQKTTQKRHQGLFC